MTQEVTGSFRIPRPFCYFFRPLKEKILVPEKRVNRFTNRVKSSLLSGINVIVLFSRNSNTLSRKSITYNTYHYFFLYGKLLGGLVSVLLILFRGHNICWVYGPVVDSIVRLSIHTISMVALPYPLQYGPCHTQLYPIGTIIFYNIKDFFKDYYWMHVINYPRLHFDSIWRIS